MKQIFKLALPIFTALGVFLYAVTSTPVNAVQGTIYFTPGSGTYNPGSTFTVDVKGKVPSSGFGGGATVNVTYPTNLLQATAVSLNGGVLGGGSPTINNGTVSYSVFTVPSRAVNDQRLFTITFKALATGSATLNFSANTNINSGPTTKQPAAFSIVNPSCPAGQVGTPPNCSTPPPPPTPTPTPVPTPVVPKPSPVAPKPSPTPTPIVTTPNTSQPAQPTEATPAPPADEKTLSIDDVDVQSSYDNVIVKWTTSGPADATLNYGTSSSKLDNVAAVEASEDSTTFTAPLSKLQLGTTYHYSIVAKNASEVSISSKGTFTTKAYPVVLRLLQNNQPLTEARVQIQGFENTYTTGAKGETTLSLKPGDYTAKITKEGLVEEQKFTIKALSFATGKTPDTQVIEIKLATPIVAASTSNPLPYIMALILGLVALGAVIAFLAWKRHRDAQAALGYQSVLDFDTSPPPEYSNYTAQVMNPEDTTYQQPYAAPSPDSVAIETSYPQPTQINTAYPAIPTYSQPSNDVLPTEAIPMAVTEIQEEPMDMWSAPTDHYSAAPDPVVAYEVQELVDTPVPPSYQAANVFSEANSLEPEENTDTAPADGAPVLAEQPVATVPADASASTEEYEYNDDNSMTIHHQT